MTMNINKILTERKLIIINFSIVLYFILIYLIYYLKLDYVLIGVFGEILTIPFFIAQIVFLILGGTFLVENKHTSFITKLSVIVLVICSIVTISSFF